MRYVFPRPSPWLTLLLALSGCAYKQAIEAASLAEQAGDRTTALAHYELALAERPGDPVAKERIAAIHEARCDDAVARAQAAMDAGAYEDGLQALAEASAIDPDRPDVFVLRERAKSDLQGAFRGLFTNGQQGPAYTILDRYRDLFGRPSWVNEGYVELRRHYTSLAAHHAQGGRYAQALAALDVIAEHEPDQVDALAGQRHAYITGWADEHTRAASALLRQDNPGGAAASWLRAWEIAGRDSDRQAAERMLDRLRKEGALTYRVETTSGRARDRALVAQVKERLASLPDTSEQHRSPHLVVRLLPSPSQCVSTVEKTPQSTPYTAGTVDVPNPDWVAVDQRVQEQVRLLEGAERKSDALFAVQSELGDRLQKAEAELVGLFTRRPAQEAAVQEATTQRDRAAELEADSLAAWEAALLERTAALEATQEAIAAIETEATPLREEQAKAQAQLQEAFAAIRSAETERDRQIAERDALPATVPRDVDDTLHWDLEDWTRTCEAELTVRLTTSWPSELPAQKVERCSEQSQDQAHIGNAAAALEEDPLVFPDSDVELLGRVDAQNVDALVPWLEELVTEHFHVRTTATAIGMANEPERATSEALRLLLGAPDRIQPEAIGLFDTQIQRAWDLRRGFVAVPPASD